MDRTLQKICGLLQCPDNARRSAGAIVLAQLAPKDPGVVKALGEALPGADSILAGHVLEALDAVGSPAAVPYVMPLLDSEDMAMRLQAAAIIAKAGGAVVPQIKARFEPASPAQKLVLVDLLARVHTREAFRTLLELLMDPNFELVKQTCEAVRRHVPTAAPKDRAAFHQEVVRFMGTARVKAQERALTSCLLLLGYIGRPEARAVLLKHAAPKMSLYLRRHALIGLKAVELSGAAAAAVSRQVAGYLDDADEGVAHHALDILGRLPAAGGAKAQWGKFLRSPHAAVRAFAARRLAEEDSAATNRELLALLRHEDTEIREIASSALAAHPGAARLLLEELEPETDAEATWRFVKILKPHSPSIDAKSLKRFQALAARALNDGDPRYEALLYFVRNVSPNAADAVLLEAGLDLRREKRWAQAVECLRRLIHTESFDDEARYALSACNLKLSLKDVTPQARAEDHALRGFHALLRNRTFDLVDRFQKDKTLDASDLYYVGFHFAETPGEDRDLGNRILEQVAKRWPKSEEGVAAKKILKLAAPERKTRAKRPG